jgi:hypothetical protein
MKFGDLIGFAYINNAQTPRLMNWVEKTQLENIPVTKIIDRVTKDELSQDSVDQLFQYAADWTR